MEIDDTGFEVFGSGREAALAFAARRHKTPPSPEFGRPHVVILGSGASLAALPNGDKNGRKVPPFEELVEIVGLEPILNRAGIEDTGKNFEALYSELALTGNQDAILREIEAAVVEYFAPMELPERPTLYDHLVLSLREKDLIATFNWDPFLFQSLARCGQHVQTPTVIFLHGSVAVGYCDKHVPMTVGWKDSLCSQCGSALNPTRLLYPVREKDYGGDPYTSMIWNGLQRDLKSAYILTVFGYGAPATDARAVALFQKGWGDPATREFEQTEIIDLKPTGELLQKWKPFIHTHHVSIRKGFYSSLLGRYPRRSCEAQWDGCMQVNWPKEIPIPLNAGWDELIEYLGPLVKQEEKSGAAGL